MAEPWAGFVTVVTGVPRSGTSLLMQLLAAGGVPLLSDGARAPDPHNPRGYHEHEAVKRLGSAEPGARPAWLAQATGRAVKVIHALVPRLPADLPCRVVWVRRELSAVLASQRAMLGPSAAAGSEPAAAVLRAELESLERWLAAHVPGDWLRVDYEALLADPDPALGAIDRLLGGGLDRAAMRRTIDASLRHHG